MACQNYLLEPSQKHGVLARSQEYTCWGNIEEALQFFMALVCGVYVGSMAEV